MPPFVGLVCGQLDKAKAINNNLFTRGSGLNAASSVVDLSAKSTAVAAKENFFAE
jgi:hypothetical protein